MTADMSFGETIILPERSLNFLSQLTALLDRAEPRVRRRFLRLIRESKTLLHLEEAARLDGWSRPAIRAIWISESAMASLSQKGSNPSTDC